MNETWAPSALPGVVNIVHNLFKSSRFCLIRYDLGRFEPGDIDSSWIKLSPTPNLSIKKSFQLLLCPSQTIFHIVLLHNYLTIVRLVSTL